MTTTTALKAGQTVTVKFECTDRIERTGRILSTDSYGTLEIQFGEDRDDIGYFDTWEVYAK